MDISNLRPGDHHYMAYVGPPRQFDFMGATQFRLLCTLGLRAHHDVLDFGCGSLRAGRLLISYLDPQRYCAVEPNKWLIDDAIEQQVGRDLVRIKQPAFDHNSEFRTDGFGRRFDFIVAQSVFSHAGADLIARGLSSFRDSLKDTGLIAATFIEGEPEFTGSGWIYPGCVSYRPSTVEAFAAQAGLHIARIPWYHPRQTWYLLARDRERLPTPEMTQYLRGAVLFDPEFRASLSGQ